MNPRRRPLRLGLTGGIGSGKSTVGGMFAALGGSLIDADQLARDVTGPQGAAMNAIRATFGEDFVDASGALDRARMRALVFSHPEARALIEFDIPLLAESGRWARRLDAVVVVDCSEETQIQRVMKRSGLAREVVQGIIASQASRTARRAVADAVIANDRDCSLEDLRLQTRQVATLFGL